jgi:hypothetical protein
LADPAVIRPPRRPLPEWATALAYGIEPLWIASLAAVFVIWGYAWIPRLIHMLGHSGQMETIEWSVYMSMLVGFPVVAVAIAVVLPRVAKGQVAIVLKAFVIVAALASALIFAIDGRILLVGAALVPAILTAGTTAGASRLVGERTTQGIIALVVIGAVALVSWMSAGGLVFWTTATSWFLGSPVRFLAVAIATAIAISGLPKLGEKLEVKAPPGVAFRIATIFALLVLIAFSFRTNPMVEFYHWGFWVGPIDQLRQGGWLLRDTPSQYGFFSILIPTFLPGSAWQSFWFYQAVMYAIVAAMMFLVFRRLRSGVGNLLLSFFIVFTTVFFRPRDAAQLLPSQWTPSGGPVRFVWCFVLIGWLLIAFEKSRGDSVDNARAKFLVTGNLLWICSVAWSFEAAIYSSAIWFPALVVFLIQRAAREKAEGRQAGAIALGIVRSALVPAGLAILLYALVWAYYKMSIGVAPDLHGYFEYGLLYSGGFGSLPIAPHGAIWYLLLVFFIASTVAVRFLVEDWRDFRLVVAAGIWGGIWSLSSYFVSRSHPANLLSLAPVLLFAIAVLLVVIRYSARRQWHAYVRAATAPALAIPIAMTLGHPALFADLDSTQLSPARFTEQVPMMDPELVALLKQAGAKPGDSYVRIVDGRLMLPAWPVEGGDRIVSDRSWLPKPYEIIGSLDSARRQVYIDRAKPVAGWLIHSQSDTISHFDRDFAQIQRRFVATRRQERGSWILWWMEPRH